MKTGYSIELCRELSERVRAAGLLCDRGPDRYDAGDLLDLAVTALWPETDGRARFLIERFVGGGYAGQVYLCRLERVEWADGRADREPRSGGLYAVKLLIPPTSFARCFRNALFAVGFQGPFSAQVNRAACHTGLLWQKLVREAAAAEFGDPEAVADVYAACYDQGLRSYGEVREWVEGRTWRLAPDVHLGRRRHWRTLDPARSDSAEYIAKRQFMARLVRLMREMGAPELARQYAWWTMKSQPNVLKRFTDRPGPGAGLCAVDFRAGLALLPFLPMSPGDVKLILDGIARGSLVQFDRASYARLRAFVERHAERFSDGRAMVQALERYDRDYRRSLPDITHQGLRLLADRSLRADVRRGLMAGHLANGVADEAFARELPRQPVCFSAYQLLGLLPGLGRFARRLWGHDGFQRHLARMCRDPAYRARALSAGAARRLIGWHRGGRTGQQRTRWLAAHPGTFWLQRFTLGLLPAGLHRVLAEPGYVAARLKAGWTFVRDFYRDPLFRADWLKEQVRQGHEEGMLEGEEYRAILARIDDPYIVKYLQCLAVHFATLPVTQIVSLTVASIAFGLARAAGAGLTEAGVRFAFWIGIFQVTPISPGSFCRGAFTLYVISRERNFRDYMVAAPLSFVKYLGYLAFPIQMVTTYPALSRFMASRWATQAVHVVPVFGEKGALLEHMVFDLFFNLPRQLGGWASRHIKGVLDVWMLIGILILTAVFGGCRDALSLKAAVNSVLAVLAVFVLPRCLFYPVLRKRGEG